MKIIYKHVFLEMLENLSNQLVQLAKIQHKQGLKKVAKI